MPDDRDQCPQQWRDEQSHNPPVHAVGATGVVGLAEFEVEAGMRHRDAQPGQHLPIVVDDIAIVQHEGVEPTVGQQATKRRPYRSPLAGHREIETTVDQLAIEALNSFAVRPENLRSITQLRHMFIRFAVVGFIARDAQSDHDGVDVVDIDKLIDDPRKSLGPHVGRGNRQHEADFVVLGRGNQDFFEPGQVGRPQVVQRGDRSLLVEVRHIPGLR
jgi:hypothetical protein